MLKRFLIYPAAVLLIMAFTGCNKEKKLLITYPATGSFGENVLALADNSNLLSGSDYSFCAELGKKAELKIVITNLSGPGGGGPGAVWFYTSVNGWTVGSYSAENQQFESNQDEKINLNIIFENGPGSCRVDYYENSSSVTNSKSFIW